MNLKETNKKIQDVNLEPIQVNVSPSIVKEFLKKDKTVWLPEAELPYAQEAVVVLRNGRKYKVLSNGFHAPKGTDCFILEQVKDNRITDVSKDKQTEELKLKVYRQMEQFVYKYWKRYYPHYKGELRDLVVDMFDKFCVPKKHRNGETFSELDRLAPEVVGGGEWTGDEDKAIATYTQRFVINRLIDMERTDKQEVRADEDYDEDTNRLTLDRAAQSQEAQSYQENTEYSFFGLMDNPQAIKNARKRLANDPEQVKYIRSLAEHYSDRLAPEVKEFINKLLGEEEKPITEVDEAAEVINSILPEVKVIEQTLQGRPAVKISFASKDAMAEANEHKDKVDEELAKYNYQFYKAHGTSWYYFK